MWGLHAKWFLLAEVLLEGEQTKFSCFVVQRSRTKSEEYAMQRIECRAQQNAGTIVTASSVCVVAWQVQCQIMCFGTMHVTGLYNLCCLLLMQGQQCTGPKRQCAVSVLLLGKCSAGPYDAV